MSNDLLEFLSSCYGADLLLMDGFEDAFEGVSCFSPNEEQKAVYNRHKMIDTLVLRDGMTPEEADEFISYNCEGAYVGKRTPIIYEPIETKVSKEEI